MLIHMFHMDMNHTISFPTVPRPDVTITSVNSPVNDQPYTATCMVQFVAAVPMDLVNIEWMDEQGSPLTELNSRVSTSPIRRINGSTYARDVIVSPIRIEDGGTYICEAGVMGAFVTSEAASESYDVVVFGKMLSQYQISVCIFT